MRSSQTFAVVLVIALVATACSSSDDADTSTSQVTSATTTGAPATTTTTAPPTTTTTAPPTTTSTEPPETTVATGELPVELLERVGELYGWLSDKRNPEPEVSAAMLEGLAAATVPYRAEVTATAVVDTLDRDIDGVEERHEIAVVHVGEDTLVATNDGAWEIVGIEGQHASWLGGPILVLVLGSDARPGQNQLRFRADSIHILAFDTDNGRGTILGFPRDAYVEGPDRGFDKFAHHMASAGPEVMLEVAVDVTGLELDGYAVTGFVGFQRLIDSLGGVLIDLPRSVNTGNKWQNFASGLQRLSSLRTLQLARARKGVPGGDFGRSANQGLIMLAILDMVQGMGVDAMPAFGQVFFDHAWSDVPTDTLAQLAAFAFMVDTDQLQNVVLPGTVQTIAGSSVVVLDDIVDEVFTDLADGWLENTDW